jgi:hypothetical protein
MANNPLRQDSNGQSAMLRSKLQGLGAGTYDPEFARQYRQQMPPQNPTVPFIAAPNPAENKSQLIKKRMLLYSGDRDDRVGSTSANFQITLNTSIDEVVKVELRSFQTPTGIFNIDATNNQFQLSWLWTLADSPYYVAHPPTGLLPPSTSTGIYASNTLTINPGSYTPSSLVKQMAKQMNDWISYYLGSFAVPGIDWITGSINEAGQIELYSLDAGLVFGIQTTGLFQAFGLASGFNNGTFPAVKTGGVYGATDYYYLVCPAKTNLKDFQTLCVQSIALGNNLIATEGGSAGFNAFTTVPISDSSAPILVRFDTTLDSTYFEPSRTAYNNLKNIDIKITDKDGFIVALTSEITLEFDVVQKIKPGTLGT